MIEVRFLASPSLRVEEVFVEVGGEARCAKMDCIIGALLFALSEGRRLGLPVTVSGRQWEAVKPRRGRRG